MTPRLHDFSRVQILAIVFIAVIIPASIGYMAWEGKSSEITVLSLDGAPQGIVFIADPHLRPENLEHTRAIIREINALQPSVVLIGGDFVYGERDNLSLQSVWLDLDAPVYAVLGNHDYQAGNDALGGLRKILASGSLDLDAGDYNVSCLRDGSENMTFVRALISVLEQNGVHVLRNEYMDMAIGNETLRIVGVDDGWAGLADPPEMPETDAFTIYMIHEPELRANWDADLTFAGHTHGGQYMLPGIERLSRTGSIQLSGIELSGLFDSDRGKVYITHGIGTSNLPVELRMFVPPEIVLINPAPGTLLP